MAMIGKIREKRNLLLIVIFAAMLLFLLPYEAIMSFFTKSDVGDVDGTSISIAEWTNENLRRQSTQLTYPNNQMENAVWSDLIEERLLGDDYKELGIDVSDEEYDAITLERTPSQFVLSTFHGGTVTDQSMLNYPNHVDAIQTNDGYVALKELIENKRKREKWEGLVKKGLYANTIEAKYDYLKGNEKVNIEYVLVKFDDIPDSTIYEANDSDIRAYYNEHKNDADLKVVRENRDVRFVEFVIEPSSEDSLATFDKAKEIATNWMTAENDTAFCQLHGAQFVERSYEDTSYVDAINTQMMNDSVGSIVGPFTHDPVANKYIINKLTGRMGISDSVQVRHILFKVENTMTPFDVQALKATADSVMDLIKTGAETFEDMVVKYSGDQGSIDKGGNYGWFDETENYVQPYKDFGFERNTGDIDIITSQFGYHLMEVVDQSPKNKIRTKYRSIEVEIRPSERTKKEGFRVADEYSLIAQNSAPEMFEELADSANLSVFAGNNIFRSNKNVGKIQNAGKLISWAYGVEKSGEVSVPLEIGDAYIIAIVDKIKKSGIPDYENVKDEMADEVVKQKKAEAYKTIMDLNTLQDVADAVGARIQTARNMSLASTNLTGSGVSGQEPEVVGLCFGMELGEMSSPIVGEFGIYVIAPSSEITEAAVKDEFITEQDRLITSAQNSFNQVYPAMQTKADVKDTRFDN